MPILNPDDYLSSVTRIDPGALFEAGIRVVLLDIDNTLVPRDTKALSTEVRAWVDSMKQAGLKLCLLSNNWHKVVFKYAECLDMPIVYKGMKPLPFGFFRAFKKAERVRGEKVAMIGDQIITDVLGARMVGAYAILVEPQAVQDLWYTHIFRKIEGLILRGRSPRI